jgi:hypothetical protein
MVKRCLLVLALAAIHSPTASAVGAHGAATPGTAMPGAMPGTAAPGMATRRAKSTAAGDRYQTWRAEAAAILVARADANSLATAAALRFTGPAYGAKSAGASPRPSALELAARASELAPQDASIGWLHLQLCSGTPACDIRDVATVMRWVDADNGAAWLQTLSAAQKDRDTTEVDRILADMAHGERFDLYWNRIVVLMVDVLGTAHDQLPGGFAASDSARLSTVSAIASGEVIPPFAALVDACRDSSAGAERHDLCLRLSKTMQRSDTVAAQLAGFGIERRLLTPDSREARTIAERKHLLEWRVAAAAKFDNPLLPWTKNARARARIAEMRAMPREEDVCIAILRQHKMALDPPEVHP